MKHLLLILMLQFGFIASAVSSASLDFFRENLSVNTAEQNGSIVTCIGYDDLDNYGKIGEPIVPIKIIRFSVPYNAVNIRLSYSLTKNCEINLTHPVRFNIEDLGQEIVIFHGSRFPLENAVIQNIGYVDGINKIVTVGLCPVSLELDNNLLTFYSNVNASLTWDIDNNLSNESIKPIVSYSKDKHESVYKLPNLINPEDVEINKVQEAKGTKSTRLIEDAYYVIVCPREFANDLERLAAYRRLKGYTTKIVAIEDILADSRFANGDVISGINDDAGKLRAFLMYAYTNMGTRYALLAGKYPAIPIRYGYSTDSRLHYYVPSDVYFAELNSSWKTSNSNNYGRELDNLDRNAEISVGRIPFTNKSEIHDFIDKLKIYEHNPGLGDSDYLARAFITRQDYGLMSDGNFKEDCFTTLKSIYSGSNLREVISTDDYPSGTDVINELNATNYGFISFVGHGSPYGVAVRNVRGSVSRVLGIESCKPTTPFVETGNGLDNLTNKNYPSWSYSISCETMPFDSSPENNTGYYGYNLNKNFGESYVLGKEYGGVLFFGHTRDSYRRDGQKLLKAFSNNLTSMYEDYYGEDGPEFPVTAGEMMRRLWRCNTDHEGLLTHNLLGDPLTQLWISKPDVVTYRKGDSSDDHYILNNNENHLQCIDALQMIETLHTGRGLSGNGLQVHTGINKLHYCEFPNSLPTIFPLYLQNITFNNSTYLVTGDVMCGNNVNESETTGNVTLADSVSLTIESLGNVSIRNGIALSPNSKLIIKADGDVDISDLTLPANTTLIVEANTITAERLSKHASAIMIIKERNYLLQHRSNPEATVYKSMLVEGRTWWYYSSHQLMGYDGWPLLAESGISVGEEVEIDGVMWHKIELVKFLELCGRDGSEQTFDTSRHTVAYAREEGNKIVTFYPEDVEFKYPFSGYTAQLAGIYQTLLCFEYNNIGESFIVCDESHPYYNDPFAKVTINSISQITNSGNEYTLYECSNDHGPIYFVEGLGSLYNLFYDPVASDYMSDHSYTRPQLRYITDPDETIIYEGIGGYKLWEETSVGNVLVEDHGRCRWYNLQGSEISEPTSAGIYIRSNGGVNEKVFIR